MPSVFLIKHLINLLLKFKGLFLARNFNVSNVSNGKFTSEKKWNEFDKTLNLR